MRLLYLFNFVILMILPPHIEAQYSFKQQQLWEKPQYTPFNTRGSQDTITTYYDRSSGMVCYSITGGSGCLFGTGYDRSGNAFATAIGMLYDGVDNARVVEVLAMFYRAEVTGSVDTVYARVYTTKDSTPQDPLGSGIRLVNQIDTTYKRWNSFPIKNAKNTNGKPFLISIEFNEMDDTIGVVANDADKHDGKGEFRARHLYTPLFAGAWGASAHLFSDLDCDAMIIPVIDFVTENKKPISTKNIDIYNCSLNYRNSELRLRYHLHAPGAVSIEIFSLNGQQLVQQQWDSQSSGMHEYSIVTGSLSSGNYYYTITTKENSLTGKVLVVK